MMTPIAIAMCNYMELGLTARADCARLKGLITYNFKGLSEEVTMVHVAKYDVLGLADDQVARVVFAVRILGCDVQPLDMRRLVSLGVLAMVTADTPDAFARYLTKKEWGQLQDHRQTCPRCGELLNLAGAWGLMSRNDEAKVSSPKLIRRSVAKACQVG